MTLLLKDTLSGFSNVNVPNPPPLKKGRDGGGVHGETMADWLYQTTRKIYAVFQVIHANLQKRAYRGSGSLSAGLTELTTFGARCGPFSQILLSRERTSGHSLCFKDSEGGAGLISNVSVEDGGLLEPVTENDETKAVSIVFTRTIGGQVHVLLYSSK